MNLQILLVLSAILFPIMLLMGYGKINWASKGKNPGGERDSRMKAKFKLIGYLAFAVFVLQLLKIFTSWF